MTVFSVYCVGNDVWIGYEAVIFAGVTVGDLPEEKIAENIEAIQSGCIEQLKEV